MSEMGDPQTSCAPDAVVEAVERLRNRTPVINHVNVPEMSFKTKCEFLIEQGWEGEDKESVERKRRKRIQKKPYWILVIGMQLGLAAEHFANAELPQLHKMAKILYRQLLELGVSPDDIENERLKIPESEEKFWKAELGFQESLQEDTENQNQQSTSTRTSPSPGPRQSHLESASRNVLAPLSINRPSPPLKGAYIARVQKRRPKNNGWTKRKQRSTKMSEQQEPPSAREEERGPSASLKPASGQGTAMTTLGEGAVPSARASRRRAGANVANQPHRPARVQKPAQKEGEKPAITRDYGLRKTSIARTRESKSRKPAVTKKHNLRSKPTTAV